MLVTIAQETMSAEVSSSGIAKAWEFLSAGGFFMLLIGCCSVLAITVIIFKAMIMRSGRIIPKGVDGFLSMSGQYVASGDEDQLIANLQTHRCPVTRPALIAFNGDYANEDTASAAVESAAREEVVKMQSGMAALEVVITIAPLLGLLGTVSGLVSVFSTLGGTAVGADADPTMLARGIAMALNTTIAGLAVAVPTVVAHTYFMRKIEKPRNNWERKL